MLHRRQFCIAAAQAAAAAYASGSLQATEPHTPSSAAQALARAVRWLLAQQHADGAWRSTTYGPLKDGPSLTAHVVFALTDPRMPADLHSLAGTAAAKATEYLSSQTNSNLTYPVYTAAGTSVALRRSTTGNGQITAGRWLAILREHQLVEALGWQPTDVAYGGWSYAHEPPRPLAGQSPSPLADPNLSATVYALLALRTAGCPTSDPAIVSAQRFLERCHNGTDDADALDLQFDDGGFTFMPDDPVRNKAGQQGLDRSRRTRYRSYGSATADGLRGLLACGLAPGHPRVDATVSWLSANFAVDSHPGDYRPERGHLRDAVFYYYADAVTDAFTRYTETGGDVRALPSDWQQHLSAALLDRQRTDGSWSNPAVDTREDDPLVATPLALRALLACHHPNTSLSGKGPG